ncbi:Hypothetical predicted protein [Olea europaea subsp. europaea]|uniref:Uncharacterized protein n=1 Tax=Olea europaea subsp. europaea TaxID=158383 RepID=A0A8S0P9S4_OLEEU|nr:Hypothetical predicted protein [Olea europaea subsp. europaea]
MAQNRKSKNSEGVCEKIFNAFSSGRKNHPVSHKVQASVSSETAPKTRVQSTDNPAKASFTNQPGFRMIPVESEPSIRPPPMTEKENFRTAVKIAGKEDATKRVSEICEQETVNNGDYRGLKVKMDPNPHGQVEKVASMKDKPLISEEKPKLKERMSSMGKAAKDKGIQEEGDEDKKTTPENVEIENKKFSDYIDRVKKRMGTLSNVGSCGDGRTDYIDHVKNKMATVSNVGSHSYE